MNPDENKSKPAAKNPKHHAARVSMGFSTDSLGGIKGMSDDALKYVHQLHRASQEKQCYFLLAVAASAVAFAVQKTTDAVFAWHLSILGIATVLWAASFYSGVKHLSWIQTALYANYGLLQLQKGVHPKQPDDQQMLELAKSGVMKAMESNAEKASSYATWQFRFLLAGAACFLIWHIVMIANRTYAP